MVQTLCFRCMRSLDEDDELNFLTRTCEKCFQTVLSSRNGKLSAYLESLDIPAALLSQDQTVLSSNGRFQRMAPGRQADGLRLGEVIECMYSPLLGRCSETVACLLCRLKKSVDHTWRTREGLRGVPISFPHKAEGRKTFTITTEIVGGAILLLMGTPSPAGAR
jgi:hypothetical protein